MDTSSNPFQVLVRIFADHGLNKSQIHIVSYSYSPATQTLLGARRCCSALESKTLDYLLPAGSQTVTEGVNSTNIRLGAV